MLLHCRQGDFVPCQPTLNKPHTNWIAAAQNHEMCLSCRNARFIEWYNSTAYALCPLQRKSQIVAIQRPSAHRWDTTGQVIETLLNYKYWVRVDTSGRITLRNRRFIRKLEITTIPLPIPSDSPDLLHQIKEGTIKPIDQCCKPWTMK